MRQAIDSLLAQEPLEPHVANYLIESMRLAMSGEDASRAFALHQKRGRKENSRRDFDIAKFVAKHEAECIKQDAAFLLAADRFFGNPASTPAIKSAYRNGIKDVTFYNDLCASIGKECADDWLATLR